MFYSVINSELAKTTEKQNKIALSLGVNILVIGKSKMMDSSSVIKSSYFEYKMSVSQKYITIICQIVGLFNLVLLIPDLILINGTFINIGLIIIRATFSLILFGISYRIKNIKTFKVFSIIVTTCEIFAHIIFLFVLSQYNHPNFLIQTMGQIIIIIAIFLVPNKWTYMIIVATLGAIVFFVYAYVLIGFESMTELWAAIVYVSIATLLCAISAWNTEKHQFREFAAKSELQHMSSTDYLTNTANRYKMEEDANRWINFCHNQKFPLSLVFIDVDDLKIINDRYGHPIGDSVLANLAKLIYKHLRGSDILARWGGDEFVLLLPSVYIDNAIIIAERIRKSISENKSILDMRVTCSFGVVEMKENSSFETLLHEADKLMYRGKKHGKNTVQWSK